MMFSRISRKSGTGAFPRYNPPTPLGAQLVEHGVQFSIFSRHATKVWLLLFRNQNSAKPSREIELDPNRNRIGDIWHVHVENCKPGDVYVYRMDGDSTLPEGQSFDPKQWLLDPYAKAIAGSPAWGDTQGMKPGNNPTSGANFPKCVVVDDTFDWSEDVAPKHPLKDLVIYEAHVRGLTAHPSSTVMHAGTYRGLIESIPHLQDLGINAIELLPIHEFNEMEYYHQNDPRKKLRNYWGYSTRGFFAPNGRYAAGGVAGEQVREFKEMVQAMHQAGIEVILDVVFNHTDEGGFGGPAFSFRGIDNSIYYMLEDDHLGYRNYTGCGNTVNCNHPIVRQFILDSLRYWVREMHVDGFRFDLASIFSRDVNGDVLDRPPIIEEIAEDPILRHSKLIAEAWDAAGLYQVGSFPNPHWSEWNGRYRDDIRRFWNSNDAMLGSLAKRLNGSDDMYRHHGGTPLKSINFIACHDGFSLHDLVSYNQKHNEANQEDNRDGDNHNHSFNYGVEGDTDDPAINQIRQRQIKNLVATLMLSQGVPMILAGDEMARTQQGSNNAYCQDSEISWLDWSRLEDYQELFQFFRQAIAMRKQYAVLRMGRFLEGEENHDQPNDVEWFGFHAGKPDWKHGRSLAFLLHGKHIQTDGRVEADSLFVAINGAGEPQDLRVPAAPGTPWKIVLSTEETSPDWDSYQQSIQADGRSVTVFASTPTSK